MEEITYLLFIKRLDELQTVKDRRANATGTPDPDPFFDEAQQDLRWQNFKVRDPEIMCHQNLPTVHKLRHNEQITEDDLAGLEEIFLAEAVASPEDLDEVRAAGGLGLFVRTLCGLDRQAAQRAFESFIAGMHLSASQLDFITLIDDVVTKRGVLDVGDLYEVGSPFHDRAPGGPDDLFSLEQIDDLKIVFIGLQSTAKPTGLAA
ncbi:HsdM-like protein [Streptomyces brevispora]|uniref:HsdM-like protein n=1 Tax=Streptomyces brevispora TaxID=887462 RepID=A0A561V2S4_9ACTN|nr:type I restriction-modification enzyme R subunit C-terminal domain-containing protein [Streptomyces brevispora]TWG05916.1 HsdM-like protein [Streptomyces brevispora]